MDLLMSGSRSGVRALSSCSTSMSLTKSRPFPEIMADMNAESLCWDWAVDEKEKITRKRRRTRSAMEFERRPDGKFSFRRGPRCKNPSLGLEKKKDFGGDQMGLRP